MAQSSYTVVVRGALTPRLPALRARWRGAPRTWNEEGGHPMSQAAAQHGRDKRAICGFLGEGTRTCSPPAPGRVVLA